METQHPLVPIFTTTALPEIKVYPSHWIHCIQCHDSQVSDSRHSFFDPLVDILRSPTQAIANLDCRGQRLGIKTTTAIDRIQSNPEIAGNIFSRPECLRCIVSL